MWGEGKGTVGGLVAKLLAMLEHDEPERVEREQLVGLVERVRVFLLRQRMVIILRRDAQSIPAWQKHQVCEDSGMTGRMKDGAPLDALAPELDVVLELAELVGDDCLVLCRDRLRRPLPKSYTPVNSMRIALLRLAHLAELSELIPWYSVSVGLADRGRARLTCLLAIGAWS